MNKAGLLCIALALFIGCQNQVTTRVHNVWTYIQEKPDSALTVLEEYSLSDFHSRRGRAEYALLKSISLDKNYIDLKTDSLISPALQYYESNGCKKERMLCWYYLGRIQANASEYNKAIVSVTRAGDYLQEMNEPYYEALVHMSKEIIYNNTYNVSEALEEAQAGASLFESIGETRQYLIALRRVALDYFALRDMHKADSVLLSIITHPLADSSLVGRCYLILGRSRVLQQKYGEAMEAFDTGMKQYHGSMNVSEAAAYAYASFKAGDRESCDRILSMLEANPSARGQYLQQRYLISKDLGQYKDAMEYQRSLIELEDSIAVRTMDQSVVKAQRDYQHQSREVFRLQAEKRRVFIWWIVTIALFLLAAVLFVSLYYKRKRKEEVARLTAAYSDVQSLLRESDDVNNGLNEQLTSARKQYVEAYKKQFSNIARISEAYFRTSGSKGARDRIYEEVRDLSSFISTDNRTYKQLERNVNKSLSDAMSLFRQEFPDRDEKEYRLVCYMMAGFPASTINLLTGLTASNIYVRKNRLLEYIRSSDVPHRNLFLLVLP